MKPARILARPIDTVAQQTLLAQGVDPLLAKLYAARAIKSKSETEYSLSALLPFQSLKNIQAASERLARAIEQQEKILIVADYDADGATACALGMRGLQAMGAKTDFLVPNRFDHGYGLTPQIAELAAQAGTDLLLTVDNGIASVAGVQRAQQLGMDVLITDHHLPGEQLPECIIVNPNQPGDHFPSKALAGVGVMFYVLMALRHHLRQHNWFSQRPEPNLAQWLDLVALGTIADVVPLDQNNRILVTQGLRRIRADKMQAGIRALFHVAKRKAQQAQAFDLGFAIGPRLNAAGRLDDMSLGIACLLSDDMESATDLALQLDDLNRERRQIQRSMQDEANLQLATIDTENSYSIVAYHDSWHQGVTGIVAGRLRETFHRPSIVFAQAEDGTLRGSGRSITGLHLRDALDLISKRRPEIIQKFGGHAMAAGLSIASIHLPAFQREFEAVCQRLIQPADLNHTYQTDGSLDDGHLNLDTAQQLAALVWGQNFPEPCFCDEFRVIRQQSVGTGHIKAVLRKSNCECEAMFFRCGTPLPEHIRVVYRLVANEWRQQMELQLYADYWEICA
ncbi:single-stranded-DNA-specific exonuclease RecJ [Snodgrassella alvi]|uniref:single-stranded-DNA-specific exonuclease RecJ n=1 Tax=Snodgrassella alvi TaxID=1196083 RepID=UPI000C1F1703|nr:single-stranded-DNA-specific exonuclease RecJ [Snodgrassella alvi]PIT15254.1 single-stranded-DNA-specific exonuclease RecJ [Snodgrassella alvi]PIT16327.1 single-stranded-DNA-specific exonuclease RecJ [Snodgrassella alvi]